jgi:flagellar FliL protein
MADENKEVEKPKGNPMMMILVILVVLLIGAVGFLAYMMMNQMNAPKENTNTAVEQVQQKEEAKDEGVFFKAAVENLVLNITNSKGREKLMKLSFSIKSVEPTIQSIVAQAKDEIIDSVIQQIAARSSEELLTVGGKELLREEMLDEINIILNEENSKNEEILRNNVKKILFTTFVIK